MGMQLTNSTKATVAAPALALALAIVLLAASCDSGDSNRGYCGRSLKTNEITCSTDNPSGGGGGSGEDRRPRPWEDHPREPGKR